MYGALVSLIPLFAIAHGELSCGKNKMELGQEQLTQIFNAAWVRVLADGTYREIIADTGVEEVITNFAGCLPAPEYAPFPEVDDLTCLAKKIIKRSQLIRFGQVAPSDKSLAGIETSDYFNETIGAIREAVIEQINLNYSIELDVHYVTVLPFEDFTQKLNDGDFDVLDQVNALGGSDASDLLRRYTRLFTCSMIGSGQYAFVKADSSLNSMEDIVELGEAGQLCTSFLSSGFTSSYFPEATKERVLPPPFGGGDIATCFPGVNDGTFDAYISIFPTAEASQYDFENSDFCADDFRAIDLSVVTATPYWIAKDLNV